MGLDMYLKRKKYIGAEYDFRDVKGFIYITIGNKELPVDFKKVSYIEEKVGYWRKANEIHKWFVDNVQDGEDDCRDAYVSLEQLERLLKICKEVKEKIIIKNDKIENADEIAEILPTSDGFFFGSQEYDSWYLEDINKTIEILKEVVEEEKELREKGFYSDFYYHSSW